MITIRIEVIDRSDRNMHPSGYVCDLVRDVAGRGHDEINRVALTTEEAAAIVGIAERARERAKVAERVARLRALEDEAAAIRRELAKLPPQPHIGSAYEPPPVDESVVCQDRDEVYPND